ncbi:MAG: DUF3108 domain-containing protein [Gammaproteobacteria bacterium]|jgi:hypothetical protein|nr:DUF3108 domain-containing protein [Gammaproteobacteria bacterium]
MFAALALSVAFWLPASAEESAHRGFTATYELRHNAALLARMERRLHVDAEGLWTYESHSSSAGFLGLLRRDRIIERSLWRPVDGRPQPLHYEYHRTGRGQERHVVLDFDWTANSVVNDVNGQAWRMALPGPAQDKLLYQYTLTRDLRDGIDPLHYAVADGGGLKDYRFERMGTEILHTRLGPLETVKLRRIDRDDGTTIWCAPALDYLPVRVEQYRDRRMLTLTISGLEQERKEER